MAGRFPSGPNRGSRGSGLFRQKALMDSSLLVSGPLSWAHINETTEEDSSKSRVSGSSLCTWSYLVTANDGGLA